MYLLSYSMHNRANKTGSQKTNFVDLLCQLFVSLLAPFVGSLGYSYTRMNDLRSIQQSELWLLMYKEKKKRREKSNIILFPIKGT